MEKKDRSPQSHAMALVVEVGLLLFCDTNGVGATDSLESPESRCGEQPTALLEPMFHIMHWNSHRPGAELTLQNQRGQ